MGSEAVQAQTLLALVSDLRKFAIINITTCGNAIDAFAETCLIPEPSTYE